MRKVTLLLLGVSVVVLIINFIQAQTTAPTAVAVPVYYVDGRVVANAHMVIGQISIPAGGGFGSPARIEEFPVSLSNAAAFTSVDSYKCFVTEPVGATLANGGIIRNIDGTHFVFRDTRRGPAWQQGFVCIGN